MEPEPMPDFASSLLDQERAAGRLPSADAIERVLGRVERTVGLVPPAAAAVAGGATAAATGKGLALAMLGAGVVAGVLGTLGAQRLMVTSSPPPALATP